MRGGTEGVDEAVRSSDGEHETTERDRRTAAHEAELLLDLGQRFTHGRLFGAQRRKCRFRL